MSLSVRHGADSRSRHPPTITGTRGRLFLARATSYTPGVQRPSFFFLALPLVAAAQLTPNSVTVTASRSTTPTPDVVRFNVTIDAGADATREDVLAAASGAGVTAANFTWNFTMTAPLTNLKSTIGLLTALQNNLAKDKKFTLSFSVSGSEVSAQSQGCAIADLLADAGAQASKLASAAGMRVGSVQAISGVTSSAGNGSVASVSSPACSITVKFSLGGM